MPFGAPFFLLNEVEILLSKCDTICFKGNIFADGISGNMAIMKDDCIDAEKITNISVEE